MTDISLGDAQPAGGLRKRKTCSCGHPDVDGIVHKSTGCYEPEDDVDDRAEQAEVANTRGIELATPPPTPPGAVNPYAPTGWRKKTHLEFDAELPSGQMCRIMRLERDDILRMGIMEYLDTFTPSLLDDTVSEVQKQKEISDAMKRDPAKLQTMFEAIDKVVLFATVAPKITTDPQLVSYGNESDWGNPNFIPVALLNDIDTFDRMYIFGMAFGRDMDDLKSVFREQTQSLDGLANQSVVQQATE